MEHTRSHGAITKPGARIKTGSANPRASVVTCLPYCLSSHRVTPSKKVLPSWTFPNSYLVYQFKTSLLLRNSEDEHLPVPWLHSSLPFFVTLSKHTFSIFDKLFINLCLWSIYNPSLRILSESQAFFTKALYKLVFLKPDRSPYMPRLWSKHLCRTDLPAWRVFVHSAYLWWTDMVPILC